MTVKVGQSERDGQKVKVGTSGGGWEQQRPARMNNLECDSKQYVVLVMETSTQDKTVRDSDWCVPVKHVAKLSRMGSVSQMVKNGNKLVFDQDSSGKDTSYI